MNGFVPLQDVSWHHEHPDLLHDTHARLDAQDLLLGFRKLHILRLHPQAALGVTLPLSHAHDLLQNECMMDNN